VEQRLSANQEVDPVAVVSETRSTHKLRASASFVRKVPLRMAVPLPAWALWGVAAALAFIWGVITLGIAVALSKTSPNTWWLVLP
jgi:hypothetical protein